MSNKASNQVHELIRALSSTEKRYFSVFANRHQTKSKKNYLRLFEAIDHQEVYNEDELIDRFRGEAFAKHFSIAKNRLYHQILKSLDAFYAQDSTEAEINQYLHYSEILFQKALYNQCRKLLNTASKMAENAEKWGALLQILRRKKRLAEITNYENAKGGDPRELYDLERSVLKKLEVETHLWKSKSDIFQMLFQKGQAREKADSKVLKNKLREIVRHEKKADLTFEAKYLIYQTKSAYYFALGKYRETYENLKANAELLSNNRDLIKDEPSMYFAILSNLTYVCAKLNKFDEVDKYLDLTRALPRELKQKVTPDLELRIFTTTYSLDVAICNLSGNRKKALHLLPELKSKLKTWSSKLSDIRKAGFYHGISLMHFLLDDYKEALKWNNELLNSIPIDKAEDHYNFGQMFHLVIHYELGNFDVVANAVKSLSRSLENRQRRYKFENLFLRLMESIDTKEQGIPRVAFEQFHEKLALLENDRFEKTVFEYFDFKSWAESKLYEKPFSAILQKSISTKDVL
ncbi:MAG: hypothetical protein ABR574_09225 [Cryomorphaceae bacterium]|nr:hypothetical protein [Flavobacteriales bacterium]